MSATPPILVVYDDDHAAGAVAGTDSPGAAGPARSIRGVVRRWMPRAGEPVADPRKGPRALHPVALSFFGERRRSLMADSVPQSHASDRASERSRRVIASGPGRGDSPGAHAPLIDSRASHPVVLKDFFAHPVPRTGLPMDKYVYSFGRGRAEGSSLMRNLLGGKGCELAEMTNLGIPVPP